MDIHRRLSLSAAAPVVLLPAKGSRTRFLGCVRNLMKNSGSPTGIRDGCSWSRFLRQYFRYLSVALVFANVKTFEGIAPLLFFKKEATPMWCSEGRLPELYFFDESR